MSVDECMLNDNNSRETCTPINNRNNVSTVPKTNKSRIYVNRNPERNVLPLRNVAKPIHKTNTIKQRKIAILSASITKPIDMIEFNDCIDNGSCVKRAFGGATASQLNYYVQATINEDKPDTMIINGGTNNLTKKKQTPEERCYEILDIVKSCHSGGVQKIFVSSITCRPLYQSKIDKVNELLNYYAGIYDFVYIDNTCIRKEHLKNDGVHLLKTGICILANNFLKYINQAPLFPF